MIYELIIIMVGCIIFPLPNFGLIPVIIGTALIETGFFLMGVDFNKEVVEDE